eukprot:m.246460 g.246460  ORF g.246460 m.246460 type:complete len:213 (+) comp15044_c0_seq1:317-955(+)
MAEKDASLARHAMHHPHFPHVTDRLARRVPCEMARVANNFNYCMAGNDVARVSMRCSDAKESGELDLRECKLISVPEAVFLILRPVQEFMSVVDLSANQLRKLNPKLFMFPSLKELNLRDNEIESIPEAVEQLSSLEIFDISGCRFTELPAAPLRIVSLKHYRCNRNRITTVPHAILAGTGIQALELRDNPLDTESRLHLQFHAPSTCTVSL